MDSWFYNDAHLYFGGTSPYFGESDLSANWDCVRMVTPYGLFQPAFQQNIFHDGGKIIEELGTAQMTNTQVSHADMHVDPLQSLSLPNVPKLDSQDWSEHSEMGGTSAEDALADLTSSMDLDENLETKPNLRSNGKTDASATTAGAGDVVKKRRGRPRGSSGTGGVTKAVAPQKVPRPRMRALRDIKDEESDDVTRELVEFAERFQTLRHNQQLSQSFVARSILTLFGTDISQTTVSRFETFILSKKNMFKLKPLFEAWVDKVREAAERGMDLDDYVQQNAVAKKDTEPRSP